MAISSTTGALSVQEKLAVRCQVGRRRAIGPWSMTGRVKCLEAGADTSLSGVGVARELGRPRRERSEPTIVASRKNGATNAEEAVRRQQCR